MKKLFAILLVLPFMFSCSSDNEVEPTTEPQKGDEVTVEQIVGRYELSGLFFDDGGLGTYEDKIRLTFNSDNSGEEFNPRTLKKTPFTWSYNDKVINFTHTIHGNINGWFDKKTLKYKAYAKPEYPKTIGTYSYKKID